MLTIDQWIKLNSQTAGKDKIFRLLQYLSRFLSHNLDGKNNLRDHVERLKIIENAFSSFRKLLRLGKTVEVLYGALRTLHTPDLFLRVTLTLSRIYQAGFLIVDNIIWIGRAGLANVDMNKWSRSLSKFWLGSIFLNILRDIYEIYQIAQRKIKCQSTMPCLYNNVPVIRTIYSCVPAARPLVQFAEEHRDVFWDCLKNLCDVWIPLTALGHVNLSPGTIGLLGTVSSIAGIVTILDPLAKLVPS